MMLASALIGPAISRGTQDNKMPKSCHSSWRRGHDEGPLARGKTIVSQCIGKLLVVVQSLEILPDLKGESPECVFSGVR